MVFKTNFEKGKKTMKANYKNFQISTVFKGDKFWNCDNRNRNNHIVTVKNTETGKFTRFEFWCSIANPLFENEYDVLNAFYCFVSDAVSGMESFSEFCNEFGYDADSMKSYKTWKACKRALEKFKRISDFSDDEIYDFVNELAEIAA